MSESLLEYMYKKRVIYLKDRDTLNLFISDLFMSSKTLDYTARYIDISLLPRLCARQFLPEIEMKLKFTMHRSSTIKKKNK